MRYDTNLAYELEIADSALKREKKVQEQKKKSREKARAQKAKVHKTIGVCAVILAMAAGFMITRNVAVYEGKNDVKKLQNELNELKEYSSQKAFELDRSLDLEVVEQTAKTKLKMVRPEKYQTVYVNIKQEDVTEITAGEVEGIRGIFNIFSGDK